MRRVTNYTFSRLGICIDVEHALFSMPIAFSIILSKDSSSKLGNLLLGETKKIIKIVALTVAQVG